MNSTWQVATGHPETSRAAADVLERGGNAFDGAVAAALTACVAEPIFCSLGGGGYALVKAAGRPPLVLDFFTQTPRLRRPEGLDFFPITGNFGTDTQEFHVGLGAAAVPGVVAGLCALSARHGSRPFAELVRAAVDLAGQGVELNPTQALALKILEPIVRLGDDSARMFGLVDRRAPLPRPGDRVSNPQLAACLDRIGLEGPDSFYRGEIARTIAARSASGGGHLTLADLEGYRVRWRRPLRWSYRGAALWSNPPPAFGGLMVALTTRGLETRLPAGCGFASPGHLEALCQAMAESENLRLQLEQPEFLGSGRALMAAYRTLPQHAWQTRRGTTQISIVDGRGNGVSMTLSNGEGCGRSVPGLGFMLNNMLGEEDINRTGFQRWPVNRRLASMMAPSLLEHGGRRMFLGTGGSNRIRTALTQVISNLVDFGMSLEEAVTAPRIHLEAGRLALEPPLARQRLAVRDWTRSHFPDARYWPHTNLYFGGVHAAADGAAAADPRRNGAVGAGRCQKPGEKPEEGA